MDDLELKKKFAYDLLKDPGDPFKVAFACIDNPNDPKSVGKALRMSQLWVRDPLVIAEKERLLTENGAKHFLPSKEEYSREVLDVARSAKDFDSKHKFYKLYAESQGFVEKPTTNITTNLQNIQNRVMVIREKGNDNDWEQNLLAQQDKLINDSKSRNK
jgi:hypothetical protein